MNPVDGMTDLELVDELDAALMRDDEPRAEACLVELDRRHPGFAAKLDATLTAAVLRMLDS